MILVKIILKMGMSKTVLRVWFSKCTLLTLVSCEISQLHIATVSGIAEGKFIYIYAISLK